MVILILKKRMKFNNFLWKTFKDSEIGKFHLNIFSNLESIYKNNNTKDILEIINSFKIEKWTEKEIDFHCNYVNEIIDIIRIGYKEKIENFDEAYDVLDYICYIVPDEDINKENPRFIFDVDDIEDISIALFILYNDFFFPYYFKRQFYLLQNIFYEFGLFLPPIPAKKDYEARFFYYLELCKSIYEFRKNNNFSSNEICAFLYGFAINVVQKYEISDILPEPKKAYFVGGGINNNGDFNYLDNISENSISFWNGNPETQPGDIILMYCLTPRSYIHSIWQAITPGFLDPFFYFYRCIYIGKPKRISPITLQEIKNDKILSELPLIKGNMQGINGRQIGIKYYNRILEILKQKGEDIDNIPQLKEIEFEEIKIKNERDVEIKLLEPLLEKLGYSNKDWQKQVKVKVGRSERIIPDYVIFPELKKGNEKGYWIWEVKYSIPSHKQLFEDANQAKSYALRFQSKGFSLVSKEGLWISDENLNIDELKYLTWKQLESNDYFSELFDIVGKKKKM